MWVLLLLGLLPLAVLPTMLDGGADQDGADDDGNDGDADMVPAGTVSGVWGAGWVADADPDGAASGGAAPESADAGEAPAAAAAGPAQDAGPEADDADAGPDPVPTSFAMAPGDGVATFSDFIPGVDSVEFHVDPQGAEPALASGADAGGSWVRVTQGDDFAEARFPGLTEPPLQDVHLVSGVLEPDLSDDAPPAPDPADPPPEDEAPPLAPVVDDADLPAAPGDGDEDGDGGTVLAPVVPEEGGP